MQEDHPSINETYCKHHYGMWLHECGCDIVPRKRKVTMVNEDKIKSLKSEIEDLKNDVDREAEQRRIQTECTMELGLMYYDLEKENARLKEKLEMLADAHKEVMSWIDNWDTPFTDDEEWDSTREKSNKAIEQIKEVK